jgi:predicted ATPase
MNDRFRLKKIAIRHFKAVRQSGEIELTPLTVFIGNNGSGKSSLIEGLEVYSDVMIGGMEYAFERWFGIENIWNKAVLHRRRVKRDRGDTHDNPIMLRLNGSWGRGSFISSLEMAPDVEGDRSRIEREFLKLPGGKVYRRDRAGRCESFNDDTLDRVRKVEVTQSACPQDWTNLCRRWQFLRLNVDAMGRPNRTRSMSSFPVLERDGSNIGQYLLSLRDASIEAYEGFLEALRFVVPYARDLQTTIADSIERRAYLEMTEENFKVPSWLLSTGTLRVAALLACLRHPNPPPLLIVEEIENGLDPRTLHLVVEEIRAAITAQTTQVILTTHSPYLLDLLDLSHVVIVEREEGQPVFRRPDVEQLGDWSRSFSPGRLYTMGRLTRDKS